MADRTTEIALAEIDEMTARDTAEAQTTEGNGAGAFDRPAWLDRMREEMAASSRNDLTVIEEDRDVTAEADELALNIFPGKKVVTEIVAPVAVAGLIAWGLWEVFNG